MKEVRRYWKRRGETGEDFEVGVFVQRGEEDKEVVLEGPKG